MWNRFTSVKVGSLESMYQNFESMYTFFDFSIHRGMEVHGGARNSLE